MKKLKFEKPKKVKISKLKETLMDLVKMTVRDRDNFTCQHCGKQVEGSNCHVSHVCPVSHGNKLAFDPINMKVLCYHCHLNWWHKFPTESGEWFKNKFPERYAYIEEYKNETVDWKEADYLEMIRDYKRKVELL